MREAGADQKFLTRDHSSLQMPAGILALPRLPGPREFLGLRIELLRQNNLEGHVFVAMTLVAARRALAFEPEHRSRVGALGTVMRTGPRGVGTSSFAPSTASGRLIGNSRWISSPSRVKNLCGSTSISTSASPSGAPPSPGRPFPRSLKTCLSRGPPGVTPPT